jgi:hypothetical protein
VVSRLAAKDGKVRPLRPAPVLIDRGGSERAPWLEPYGGDPQWRRQMWGALVALHGRYPTQLEALKDKWWKDDSQTETLCALAVWRAELDDTGQDPRDELAFQNQLTDYHQLLSRQSGGVTKTWKPGPPPPEWAPKEARPKFGAPPSRAGLRRPVRRTGFGGATRSERMGAPGIL